MFMDDGYRLVFFFIFFFIFNFGFLDMNLVDLMVVSFFKSIIESLFSCFMMSLVVLSLYMGCLLVMVMYFIFVLCVVLIVWFEFLNMMYRLGMNWSSCVVYMNILGLGFFLYMFFVVMMMLKIFLMLMVFIVILSYFFGWVEIKVIGIL